MEPYAHAGGDRVIQPYMRKKLTPRTLLPFPWDAESTHSHGEKAGHISKEDAIIPLEEVRVSRFLVGIGIQFSNTE